MFIVVPFINSTGFALGFYDRCRSGFALGDFLSEESCRHKLVVSTSGPGY